MANALTLIFCLDYLDARNLGDAGDSFSIVNCDNALVRVEPRELN